MLKKIPKILSALVVVLLAMASNGCNQKQGQATAPAAHRITIGVTYQNLQNEFIVDLQQAMRDEAKKLNVDLVEVDAQGSAENQISQTQDFISRGVDAIILSPYDEAGSAPAVDLAVQAHKPIIVVNAGVTNLAKADAYVGSENVEAGRIEAQRIMDVLHGKGSIAVIHGPNGHSAEIQRSEGIRQVLAKYPDSHIILEQTANWDRTQALDLMENWLASGRQIDAVIAENDEMALGAYKAIEAAGKQKEIAVIGIDAIPDGLKAVAAGQLVGTVFQDAKGQGSLAVDLAVQAAQGQKVKHDNYLPFVLVTKENVADFLNRN